ncbi:lysophospholipid acyltransferase 7 [Ceratitis capitata]|uniref:Lysophospholipid acyltransferase 7 n=1 Tax=Ceratitis capitata TaxID=7213 RepID=A0A811UGS8_CERCA|nr:lysophospholipid acyltransferase 7 [Ceratitis capitata]CAD6997890.1 unnamed protein product [Ceratitis capitata]
MSLDDVIYVICLLGCIGAGHYVKKINDETTRKFISTGLGLLVVFIASGIHALHCIISTTIGSLAVIHIHPRNGHLITFCIMFGYLIFFRLAHIFGLPNYPGHTNMIQMVLTLKVSGVAFEKTDAWKKLQKREKEIAERQNNEGAKTAEPLVEITDYDVELQNIGFLEIFHYCFNYIGVLTGPYYRYRTYLDYFEMPFKDYAPHINATLEKLKYACLYCVLYLAANYIWPLEYALTDEFYQERSFIYRLMYVWPTFFTFRMRIYTGLTLSECVCTMAGFGAYPDEADVANGEGPRKQYTHLRRDAEKRTYNFTTIVNVRVRSVETCWTFREGMRHWNICIQYWLAMNVYRLFPSKKYRTIVTLLCSAFWHGFRPGHYFCIMGAPFYVALEDVWHKLVRKDAIGLQRQIIDVIFWIAKFFAFSYLGISFLLASFTNIWKYYNSVYHIGYLSWCVFMILGVIMKSNKRSEQKEKDIKTANIEKEHLKKVD